MSFEEKLPGVKKNVSLAEYTTFRIGGKAQYFFEAKTEKDLIKAIKTAKTFGLPFFILGGGSNVLVSDKGYKGLVIRTQSAKRKAQNYNSKLKTIYAEAGAKLNDLLTFSIKKSLTGLEWAVGIPGTLAGAIYGNVGWPGNRKNISKAIKSIRVFDINSGKIKNLKPKDGCFNYRESIFKNDKNLVILGAILNLKKGNKEKIKKEIAGTIKTRKTKIPPGFSAGCIFKNPKDFSAGRFWLASPSAGRPWLASPSAGELIDKCGLKGRKIGQAQISQKHANFIINLGGAKAKDVKALIKLIKQKVKNKFGIKLEEEIQYLE